MCGEGAVMMHRGSGFRVLCDGRDGILLGGFDALLVFL